MNSVIDAHDRVLLLGESATPPIEPRDGALAALLHLAGRSPQRRCVLPARRRAAHSGASNCRFQADATRSPSSESERTQVGTYRCMREVKGNDRCVNAVVGSVKTAPTGTCHAMNFGRYACRNLAELRFRFNRHYNIPAMLGCLLCALLATPKRMECEILVSEPHR